ncbi:S1 RNA-binding domain-containing protein [Streptomyces albus]|uniref:S1 RNA-binding domain-containing protein n=1 Tax=Streptomyces TaxID=1883 RepID=UPI000AAB3942|nr:MULTISPECIES: S1 RNA-binding domain-containing protein [Streptomyces]MDI6413620.1 S1 RNA-binding domain-containing protein [Streptomyces albus]
MPAEAPGGPALRADGSMCVRVTAVHRRSESPELWAYLESLQPGEILSGTVAAVERFGVFVALDNGPAHPTLPGVGFVTPPELSWRAAEAPASVVEVGKRVSGRFLRIDAHHAEARLSLKAVHPDPFQTFADRTTVGQTLPGTVCKVLPFGAFVDLGEGILGLIPFQDVHGRRTADLRGDFRTGDETSVVVSHIERSRRRVFLRRS